MPQLGADLIAVEGAPAAQAVESVTSAFLIVMATVADPFACALNGIEMLDVRLGDTVVFIGSGPIGCWQAVMARDRGASKVFLTDVNRQRLDVALRAVGSFVDDSWVAGEDNGVAAAMERTEGRGPERVIVAAPSKTE